MRVLQRLELSTPLSALSTKHTLALCRSDSGAASFLRDAWEAVRTCGEEDGWHVSAIPHRHLKSVPFEQQVAQVGVQKLGPGAGSCPAARGT